MTLESIAVLREKTLKYAPNIRRQVNMSCNEIEREVAMKYMELPVDADGVPIRVGDVMETSEYGKRFTCTGYSYQTEGYAKPRWSIAYHYNDYDGTTEFVSAHSCRHVKPRTIEDVLDSYEQSILCAHTEHERELVRRQFADELRGMMGVDNG